MKVLRKLWRYSFLATAFVSHATTADTALRSQVSFQSVVEQPYTQPHNTYRYGSHASQYIQHWNAPGRPDSAANVIFIHGGCWLKEYDIRHSYPASTALRNSGLNVWSVEYRRLGEEGGNWPASLNDVKTAIEYIQQKINNEPIVVMGHSAGGHLALLATSNDVPSSKNIDTVIGLAAITDMVSYTQTEGSCNSAASALMKTAYKNPSDYQNASVKSDRLHPNTWLMQGTADTIVPMSQTRDLNVHRQIIDGAGHFDLIHPHSVAWKAIIHRLDKELNP